MYRTSTLCFSSIWRQPLMPQNRSEKDPVLCRSSSLFPLSFSACWMYFIFSAKKSGPMHFSKTSTYELVAPLAARKAPFRPLPVAGVTAGWSLFQTCKQEKPLFDLVLGSERGRFYAEVSNLQAGKAPFRRRARDRENDLRNVSNLQAGKAPFRHCAARCNPVPMHRFKPTSRKSPF